MDSTTSSYPSLHVIGGDAFTYSADILCVFHAANVSAVIWRMIDLGILPSRVIQRTPKDGKSVFIKLRGPTGPRAVLMVESSADHVDYHDLSMFGRNVFRALISEGLNPASISLILHGPGYGLDTEKCFDSLVSGLREGTAKHKRDLVSLQDIFVVELEPNRRIRMEALLPTLWSGIGKTPNREKAPKRKLGQEKQHLVFVAMPFSDEFADVWEYGIYNPVRNSGCVCERSDKEVFAGDVLDWIKDRIRQATLVIADVTTASPNVYLEIGYAWGVGKPVILVSRDSGALKFDIRNHRCIMYKTIKSLEDAIRNELPMHLSK